MMAMYLAGVSGTVEDIAEDALGAWVSPSTVSNLSMRRIYAKIKASTRPNGGRRPYLYLDGIVMKRGGRVRYAMSHC